MPLFTAGGILESTLQNLLVSTFGAATLVGVVAWFGRVWIKERLSASIRLDTDRKLARFKSDLESANQRILDLTSTANSANAQVESALLRHRISAIQEVWEAVLRWQEFSVASMMLSILPDDYPEKYGSDPGTKSTFEVLLKNIGQPDFLKKQNQTELVRPFLSEEAWALYYAYHSFLSSRLTKATLLTQPSIDHAGVFSRFNERELVTKSAPDEIVQLYEKNPLQGTESYLRFLRESLLQEFRDSLSGRRAGSKALQNASEIIQVAEQLASKSLARAKGTVAQS